MTNSSPSNSPRISRRAAVAIVDYIADQLEDREPDARPNEEWAGDDWRVGRTLRHSERIYRYALALLPDFVCQVYEEAVERDEA